MFSWWMKEVFCLFSRTFSIPLLIEVIFLFSSSLLGSKPEIITRHSGCFSLTRPTIFSIALSRFCSGWRCSMSLVPQCKIELFGSVKVVFWIICLAFVNVGQRI